MIVFYDDKYTAESDLETISKACIIAHRVRQELHESQVVLKSPEPLTQEEALLVHGADYVDRLLRGDLSVTAYPR